MRHLERSLEKIDEVRKKKILEMIGTFGSGQATTTPSTNNICDCIIVLQERHELQVSELNWCCCQGSSWARESGGVTLNSKVILWLYLGYMKNQVIFVYIQHFKF